MCPDIHKHLTSEFIPENGKRIMNFMYKYKKDYKSN